MSDSKANTPTIASTWAPLPELTRGYGIHMYSTKKNDTFTYCSGRLVIIRSLADPSVSDTFAEHKAKVNVAAFSPNGEWIASGDDEGKVIVWAVKSKIIKNTIPVNKKICDICWSPDGQRIIAVGDGNENKAKAFTWDSGNTVGSIDFHSKAILSVSYKSTRPFRVATGSEDYWVNFYEGPPFKWVSSNKENDKFVTCVRYSPDGTQYISTAGDKIMLFDGKEGTKIKDISDSKDGHKGTIYSFSWSPDGKSILTASADKTAKIWDIASGTVKTTFTFSKKATVQDQQLSTLWHVSDKKDEYLLTVSLSGVINYLDVNKPDTPKRIIQGHMHPALGLCYDKNTGVVYTSDADGQLTAWTLSNGTQKWFEGQGHGHGKSVVSIASTADGLHLWTAGLDDKVRFNEVKGLTYSADGVALGGMPVQIAAANKDNELAAVVIAQEKLLLLRGAKIVASTDLGFRPNCVSFSSDDKEIAVGGIGKIYLFEVSKDSLKAGKVLSGHTNKVLAIRYSPDNSLMASSDSNRSIFFWKNGEIQNNTGWPFHNSSVNSLSFSPNGQIFASCASDQDIIVWSDLKGFEHTFNKIPLSHPLGVDNIQFIDDKTIISSGADRTIKIWKL